MSDEALWTPLFERIPEAKRARILRSAAAVFADSGLAGASTADIADGADISVGSLFNYFPTKEKLYLAVVEMGLRTLEESLRPVFESGGRFLTKVSWILDAIFESRGHFDDLNRVYNRFTTESDSELAIRLSNRLEGLTARAYASLVAEAQASGEIRADLDPSVIAFCLDNIFLMLQFSMSGTYHRNRMELYLGDAASDADKAKQGILDFIASALEPRSRG